MKTIFALLSCFILLASCQTNTTVEENNLQKAEQAWNKKDYQEALAQSENVLKTDSSNVNAWTIKARSLQALKRNPEAIEAFSKCIALAPQTYDLYRERANLYMQAGDFANGLNDIDFAAQHVRGDYKIHKAQFSHYIMAQKYEEGLELADTLMAQFPDSADLFRLRGDCFTMLRKYSNALADARMVWKLDPGKGPDMHAMGYLLMEMGQYNEAIEQLSQAIQKLDSKENSKLMAYAYNNLGFARMKAGKPTEALLDINRSIELLPTNSYAFRNRAFVYIALGKTTEACADLEKAIELGFTQGYGNEVLEKQKEICH